MRKQPLLALASTALALSSAGAAVAADGGGPRPATAPRLDAHAPQPTTTDTSPAASRPPATSATLVTDLRTAEVTKSLSAASRGNYALAAVSFAVTGQPVLGTWQSPLQRYLVRRHALMLARRHAAALARAKRARLARRAAVKRAAMKRAAVKRAAARQRHAAWLRRRAAQHTAEKRAAAKRRHAAWLRRRAAQLKRDAARHHERRYVPLGGVWAELRSCESGNNYQSDTGNGFYGAYQFSLSTWWSLGYTGLPNEAAPAIQDLAATRLEARRGWAPWPDCSVTLGL